MTDTDARRVIFGPGRVRVSGSRVRGITPTSPSPVSSPPVGGGHGQGIGRGAGGGRGHGKGGGGNSLAALAAALGAVSVTGGKVLPSSAAMTTWYFDVGSPAAATGVLNDWYCNELNRDVYVKASALVSPTWGATAWSAAASGTSPVFAMPTGITAGHLLVMFVACVDVAFTVAPAVSTPAGWTRFINKDLYETGNHGSVYAFWKVAAGSDPSVTLTLDRSSFTHGSVTRYTGANTLTPLNVVSPGTVANVGATLTTAAVTTTANGCLVVSYGIVVSNPTLPWAAPSGITVRAGDNTASGRVNGQEFGDTATTTAGTFGDYIWTPSDIGSQPHYGVTFALAPPAVTASWTRVGSFAA